MRYVAPFITLFRWLSRQFSQNKIGWDEKVLRRIPKAYYKADREIQFEWIAFKPGKEDDDGVSVYREKLVTPAQLDGAARKPGTYYVARLSVRSLRALNLTVVPTKGSLPGHSVIPEFKRAKYQENQNRCKELMLELARLAGQDIVLRPTS